VSKGTASAASVLYREWLGVGINNARVVNALSRRPGIAAMDLTKETGLDKAVISRSVHVLHGKGMIRFDLFLGPVEMKFSNAQQQLPPGTEVQVWWKGTGFVCATAEDIEAEVHESEESQHILERVRNEDD